MSIDLKILQPSQVTPEPWANGGGRTRTLLAWPDPGHWVVRISVADVEKAGPFSVFAGVDRWFAVLEGDGVDLATGGHAPVVVRAADEEMHAFPGDVATDCAAAGRGGDPRPERDGATRRGACDDSSPAGRRPALERRVARVLRVRRMRSSRTAPGAPIALAPHTLAWLENRARGTQVLQLSGHAPRGWWIEANKTTRDDDQAD